MTTKHTKVRCKRSSDEIAGREAGIKGAARYGAYRAAIAYSAPTRLGGPNEIECCSRYLHAGESIGEAFAIGLTDLVDEFVAVKAPNFNRIQYLSISSPQEVQHQPVTFKSDSTRLNTCWNLVRDQGIGVLEF